MMMQIKKKKEFIGIVWESLIFPLSDAIESIQLRMNLILEKLCIIWADINQLKL